jgi:hypothetical protein
MYFLFDLSEAIVERCVDFLNLCILLLLKLFDLIEDMLKGDCHDAFLGWECDYTILLVNVCHCCWNINITLIGANL